MSALAYIRDKYHVPAKRGGRVRYTGGATPVTGTITWTSGPHLLVRPDADQGFNKTYRLILHPTWKVEYLDQPISEAGQDSEAAG